MATAQVEETAKKEISIEELTDKIRGGWVGQMVGVSFGYPTEFAYKERVVPVDELPEWKPEMISEALNQDDLYVDITFASVLDQHGLDASSEHFGAMFRDAKYSLWHANLAARRALRRGVPATESGSPRYNMHANDIDFQIEADFIGLMSPGMPQESNKLGLTAGRVVNYGDGILGGMFISAMYASAFFSTDVEEIVRAGLAVLPADSGYGNAISDVLLWHAASPDDWKSVWQQINDKWSGHEACPAGALDAFNIDAKLNGAYVALGLLYGAGDFEKTLLITTQAGQDSDCNPASALGVLGVVHGFTGIPEKYTTGVEKIADDKFAYTTYSLNDIVDSTVSRALKLVERTGGSFKAGAVTVNTQSAVPAIVEAWDNYGKATQQVHFDDERWQWSGDWRDITQKIWRYELVSRVSDQKDAEARISFSGTGAAITGMLLPTGGKADIYLDGKLSRTIDVYPDEPFPKATESLWHEFGLENTSHTIRIVVRGEPYEESDGAQISISSLIVFE